MSLRLRLNLMIGSVMLVMLCLGALLVVRHAQRAVLDEAHASMQLALQLIDSRLASGSDMEHTVNEWLSDLARLDDTRHLRIFLEKSGMAIASPDTTDTPTSSPPGWFVWLVEPRAVSVEKKWSGPEGASLSLSIQARPEDEIAETWIETRGFLLLTFALAVSVYLLVHGVLGRAFRSVEVILDGLEHIERGHYDRRLPSFALPEFERISRTFNHAATSLAKAQEENRRLTAHSLAIQEEERRHLARELHDELGQSLTGIKIMAASLRQGGEQRQTRETVGAIVEICDRLFGVVRAMMHRLHPLMLDELGLSAALEDLVSDWRTRHPALAVRLECQSDADAYPETGKIHLFRIVQECLTNVVKHADARRVEISLRQHASPIDHLALDIRDDGHGFDPGYTRGGFGLHGVRERVDSLGGQFQLESAPDAGVSIRIRLPFGGAQA